MTIHIRKVGTLPDYYIHWFWTECRGEVETSSQPVQRKFTPSALLIGAESQDDSELSYQLEEVEETALNAQMFRNSQKQRESLKGCQSETALFKEPLTFNSSGGNTSTAKTKVESKYIIDSGLRKFSSKTKVLAIKSNRGKYWQLGKLLVWSVPYGLQRYKITSNTLSPSRNFNMWSFQCRQVKKCSLTVVVSSRFWGLPTL